MKKFIFFPLILLGFLTTAAMAGSDGINGSGAPLPEVENLLGLTPVTPNSCLAIWVPMSEGQALLGLKWFNNDGLVVFPEVLLESGTADNPVSLTDCHLVAQNVSGESLQWSEIAFIEPVRCASNGLYVLFKFPEGVEYTEQGTGGGPAVGFCADAGCIGWMSLDGEDWVKMDGGFGFAVVPEYGAAEGWMLEMHGAHPGEGEVVEIEEEILVGFGIPSPNPFNPAVELRFGLEKPTDVELSIYDIRGHRVARLIDGPMERGNHSVTWVGTDSQGRRMSSGVYFARMKSAEGQHVRKLMLVK